MLSQRVECCLSFTSSAFASLGGMHPALLSRLSPISMGEISTSSVQNRFRMLLNAPCSERLIQTCNQCLIVKRFGKKANRAGRKCLCPCFHFRKSGNENDR